MNRTSRLRAAAATAALALAALATAQVAGLALARDPAPDAGTTYQIPYRLTETNHFLVRARVDGKGPFNFLVDTGAPLLFISTETAEKVGLKVPEGRTWAPVKSLEFEGGATLTDLKAVVEDPFQLVGMNALGLPGASIDGILGYTVLARFRLQIDPTRDRMAWTRLDFEPADPLTLRSRKAAPPAELRAMNAMGPLAKLMAALVGKQPEEQLEPRGGLGLELAAGPEGAGARVVAVQPGSPAAAAGVEPGDRLVAVLGREVKAPKDARAAVAELKPGDRVGLSVRRGDRTLELNATAGPGF